ncbi:MAG: right-handed parallel beta-helix repeat-containing protein [Fibrella sp.]|nr:right-handed parallel beta-helix repeat-containing protein [Armatimonadota bacterium]
MFSYLSRGFLGFLVVVALLVSSGVAQAVTYYVDPFIGQDYFNGTSMSANYGNNTGPWRTLDRLQGTPLRGGDKVLFRKGSVFTTGLIINRDGNQNGASNSSPVTFGAYGDSGYGPVFEKGNNIYDWAHAIDVKGRYIVIEGIEARKTHEAGIYLWSDAHHVKIRGCKITDVGIAIYLDSSSDNEIYNNLIVSLHLVESSGNNDFGANGVWLNNSCSNNVIRDNTFSKCRATSLEFGTDGGALEIYSTRDDSVCNNNVFTRNRIDEGNGVVEIGAGPGGRDGLVSNLSITYNVCYKNGYFNVFHTEGGVRDFENIYVDHNTVVEPNFVFQSGTPVIGFDPGFPGYEYTTWTNNIFYIGRDFRFLSQNFQAVFWDNTFHLENPGFTLYNLNPSTNGNNTGNPLFQYYDPTKSFESQNFRLRSPSPASGRGAYAPGGLQ